MRTVKAKLELYEDMPIIVPIVIPEIAEVKLWANQLHQQGQAWRGEMGGWQAEYNPERAEPPLDSKMTFTPADFCMGESDIWFYSLMWEQGKDNEPIEYLDESHIVGTLELNGWLKEHVTISAMPFITPSLR